MLYPLSYGGDNSDATNERAGPQAGPASVLAGRRRSTERALEGRHSPIRRRRGWPVCPSRLSSTSARAKASPVWRA